MTATSRLTEAAVVSWTAAPFVLQPVDLSAPRAGEVMVALEACGVCHADVAAQRGQLPFPLPGVLGHEGVGRVVEVGSGVDAPAVGSRVVVSSTSCGRCEACLNGAPVYCRDWPRLNLFGGDLSDGSNALACCGSPLHGRFFGQSAFARHMIVAAHACVPAPEDLPAAVLAPLGCGVQTGVGAALLVLRPSPGDRVAVFGAGAVGLSTVMGLKLTGAAQVIAVDMHSRRLELARELGATHTLDAGACDVAAEIARLTGQQGLAGAVETSGNAGALQAALSSLRAQGICVVVGVPGDGASAKFDVTDVVARGLRVVGANQGDANPRTFIPRLIELHRQGRLPVERLVTCFPFAKINDAVRASLDGRVVKPVLEMG